MEFHNDRVGLYYSGLSLYLEALQVSDASLRKELIELEEASRYYYVLKKFNWLLFSTNKKILDVNVDRKFNGWIERNRKESSSMDISFIVFYNSSMFRRIRKDNSHRFGDINVFRRVCFDFVNL